MQGRTADSEGLAIHLMQPRHAFTLFEFKSTGFSLLKRFKYRYSHDNGERMHEEDLGVF
jgi:hypothetical protein